jgi:hypothetical protein
MSRNAALRNSMNANEQIDGIYSFLYLLYINCRTANLISNAHPSCATVSGMIKMIWMAYMIAVGVIGMHTLRIDRPSKYLQCQFARAFGSFRSIPSKPCRRDMARKGARTSSAPADVCPQQLHCLACHLAVGHGDALD